MSYSLAIDLGGSTYRARIVNDRGNKVGNDETREQPGLYFRSLEDAIEKSIRREGENPERVVVAIAGPVDGKRATVTNIPEWPAFDAESIENSFDTEVILVNDLVAMAQGTLSLTDTQRTLLWPANNRPLERKLVLAVSTGAGGVSIVWEKKRAVFVPSESGHRDFAPRNALDRAYLNWLEETLGKTVSYEDVASCGHGFFNALSFVTSNRNPGKLFGDLFDGVAKTNYGKVITEHAFVRQDSAFMRATALVGRMIGLFIANETVHAMPKGGVTVVSPMFNNPELTEFFLTHPDFAEAVLDIGRENHRDEISNYRISLVGSGDLGLSGAAKLVANTPVDGIAHPSDFSFS